MAEQALTKIQKTLSHAGVLGREFRRVRDNDNLDWKIEQAYALEQVQRNESLQKCEPDSIGRSIIDAAVLGLSLSPAKKEAYLIPYFDRKQGKSYCTLTTSYLGMEQIAYRTGFVEMIQTNLVCKGDTFDVWTDENGRHISHTEGKRRGEVTHAYCIAFFSSGRKHIEVMDKQQLIACRDAAAKKNGGKTPFTWTGGFRGEMYKKSVLRRAWKHWPRHDNPTLTRLLDTMDKTDPIDFDDRIIEDDGKIGQKEINELIQIMEDGGVPAQGHDAWLAGLAKRMGYRTARSIKTADFEDTKAAMKEGVEKWHATQSESTAEGAA